MHTEMPVPRESIKDRRSLAMTRIVVSAAFGAAAFSLAAWFVIAAVQQNDGEPRGNQPDPVRSRDALAANPPPDSLTDFVSSILGDTEDVWREQFRVTKQSYREPRLVLFTGKVPSACGAATSAIGPFYCPLDEKIYIDLSFFQELKDWYHADADFARAYVIAHEVGHHVQKLLKIPEKAFAHQQDLTKEQNERVSVRLELQADFFAGVWAHDAHKARQILEPGDVEAALGLLAAIGDDRKKPDAPGEPNARSMTRCWDRRHGTGEQKIRWFKLGLKTGDLSQGDTIDVDK